eukprot:CAMPEP_0194033048 /NCGR_PEP_ID=MMETSP0009_2-20130614/5859_1 /TAXON_ID=210454 /ORGANISM="Grammatophora oceanica, Strain CCMP 410" /LENGTH=87 /DNA_ID=CAMNT_0038673657 /DNA_START=132 /DNA_END=395 /DNA_ORIENTATION=+
MARFRLKWSRELATALVDGDADISRPCDKLLQEIVEGLDGLDACFKGLHQKPQSSSKPCHWPCDDNEQNSPDDGEKWISRHGKGDEE